MIKVPSRVLKQTLDVRANDFTCNDNFLVEILATTPVDNTGAIHGEVKPSDDGKKVGAAVAGACLLREKSEGALDFNACHALQVVFTPPSTGVPPGVTTLFFAYRLRLDFEEVVNDETLRFGQDEQYVARKYFTDLVPVTLNF